MRPGWSDGGAVNIEGVGRRRLALAETPDLDLMVARFAPRETAQFFAALELPILQRGVRLVGWLRQIGVWKHPERAAGPFAAAAHLLEPFGTDRGAMFVEVLGRDAHDRPTYARWTLLAPEGRGPYVPTLPALALARALLSRAPMKPGARACVGDLALDDLGADFARHGIATRIDRVLLTSPLEAALGDAFAHAPPAICAAHRAGLVTHFSGFARVRGAANPLTALARRLVGFPSAAEKAPVRVTMRLDPDATETWTRRINGSRFESHLRALAPGLVEERFGPLRFRLAVSCDAAALRMEVVSWSLGPLPLPRFLAPRSMAIEHVDEAGRFSFDVPIALPFLGRVTHYQGALTLETRP